MARRSSQSVPTAPVFCSLRNGNFPNNNDTFIEILQDLVSQALLVIPAATPNALNNCRGRWYELIIARCLWDFRIANNKRMIALLLPTVSRLDLADLYIPNLKIHIDDLKQKVNTLTGARLITSNPDFVIIDPEGIDFDPALSTLLSTPINQFTQNTIHQLEQSYTHFLGKCSFENIAGYLSVKVSLKPDRRLQFAHEGSLVKATYMHLQTREWIINPKGLKYYAASTSVDRASRNGLKTVATHSIINVQSLPQAAVDEIFEINTLQQAHIACGQILVV